MNSPCPGGCGAGVCDEWRAVCECPLMFTGERCGQPLLPACMLGNFAIPIRSWVLHAFHENAGRSGRWIGSGSHPIGPVPCDCLQQFVATPFILERTRLQYMRGFTVRCIDLAAGHSLAEFLEEPEAAVRSWRRFSFGAAHDALRMSAEPSLRGASLGDQELSAHIDNVLRSRKTADYKLRYLRPGNYHIDKIRSSIPPLLLDARAAALPLLPLARCRNGCGGIGWCEDSARLGAKARPAVDAATGIKGGGGPRCGCFVPRGLDSPSAGGHQCTEPSAWRVDQQPQPHWGPSCFLNCSGRGQCDWQGFCKCESGYYGIDCALTRRGGGRAVIDIPPLEQLAAVTASRNGPPSPLTRIEDLLDSGVASPNAGGNRGGGSGGIGGGGGRRGGRGEGTGGGVYYVVDTPPMLRFGVDFAGHVEHSLTERMLRSVHRSPTASGSSFLWYPGAPLVIDGHRLLARLWHVATVWLGAADLLRAHNPDDAVRPPGAANSAPKTFEQSVPQGLPSRPLVLMPVLTERASMDSFQLSYSDDDREEWPALLHSPHVRDLLASQPTCGTPEKSTVRSPARSAVALPSSSYPSVVEDEQERLRTLLRRRRHVTGRATLYGLFDDGGYESVAAATARTGCRLPPGIRPSSPTRIWAGLQFSGNPRSPVFFQRGRDIVIPQMLLLRGGGSHADQPSCEQMASTSPLSATFKRRDLHRNRSMAVWFGGHPGHGDARTKMFQLHARRPGFALVNSQQRGHVPRDAVNMSLSSAFCWVPRGQGQGDPTRHMVAIFHGCVPIFTLGRADDDDALPFDELLPWHRFSLRVPTTGLHNLHSVVNAVLRRRGSLEAMQAELGCAWRSLFWTSLKGSCFGEGVRGDAFDALILVLRRRVATAASGRPCAPMRSACGSTLAVTGASAGHRAVKEASVPRGATCGIGAATSRFRDAMPAHLAAGSRRDARLGAGTTFASDPSAGAGA
jgi:hypothetical protein